MEENKISISQSVFMDLVRLAEQRNAIVRYAKMYSEGDDAIWSDDILTIAGVPVSPKMDEEED